MISLRELVTTKVTEAGGRLTVRSALNPILWLAGIVTVPSLAVLPFMSAPPSWLIVLAFSPVIAAIFGFLFLLIFDRDKLQSEDYQIKKSYLELIEEKGSHEVIAAVSADLIENPDIPLIPPPEEGEE